MASKMSPKQKQFVKEYIVDFNAAQAAIRAGYSKKTAKEQATRLLTKVHIQAAVQAEMGKRARRTEITQDWVINELRKIAEADAADYAQVVTAETTVMADDPETGETRPVVEWVQRVQVTDTDRLTKEQRAAIAGIKQTRNGIEVSVLDRMKALELLGKHLGMFDARFAQVEDEGTGVVELPGVDDDGG